MKNIHINCDLGEGSENDKLLMPLISACNIACGGHAGTLETMQHTIDLAMEYGVEIGAHPSYPDKENFGRKSMRIPAEELKRSLVAQILSLKQIAEAEGAKLNHVKPHGALYNDARKDENVARIIIEAISEFEDRMQLYAPENSTLAELAKGKIPVVYEAFADRNYNADHSLVSRSKPNALIIQKGEIFEHLFQMVSEGKISCENGQIVGTKAETFCLHSDTPNSVEILQYLHQKFAEKGIKISNT